MSRKTTLVNTVHGAKKGYSLHGEVVFIPAPAPPPSKTVVYIGQSLIILALVGLIGLTYFTLYIGERSPFHLTDGVTLLFASLIIIPPVMWVVKQMQRFTKR